MAGVLVKTGAAGRKRKPSTRAVSRPSDEEVRQIPPVVYEPENPINVGETLGYGIQAPYAYVMYYSDLY